ncbi:hypothetical protein [Amycolatopsis sp. NPDC098790]|uniref:hypothetical protein n=1 Tax=Amycolatopsis sp. NPDC098790 TaxID=3363939 RepID=UPI0037F95677
MSGNTKTTEAVVRIDADSPVVTVIERFGAIGAPSLDRDMSTVLQDPEHENPGSVSDAQVVAATSYLRERLSRSEGFVAGLLLAGHRGELALYSQWRPSGEPSTVVPDAWSLAPALPELQRVDSRAFAVDFTAPGPVTEVLRSRVARAHFGVFTMTPDRQEELLVLARRHAPDSLGTPGLAAVNFHRSLDGERVVNLGVWNDFGEFGDLLGRPGFTAGAEYWQGVSGFHPHFFDIAAVVTR